MVLRCFENCPEGCESSDSESEAGDTLHVAGETLEDDEELSLHILGLNSYFCKFLADVNTQSKYNGLNQRMLSRMPKKATLESYMAHVTVVFEFSTYSSCPASSLVLPRHVETNGATALSALPTRYLAPSSIKMLWMQFRQERSTKVSYLANENQVDQVLHSGDWICE